MKKHLVLGVCMDPVATKRAIFLIKEINLCSDIFFRLDRGRMLITQHPHGSNWKPLLPQDDLVDICRDTNFTIKCFKAGIITVQGRV